MRTRRRCPWGTDRPRAMRGFTLVELLVVVAIIALLVAILMPTLSRATELARRAVCASSLHGLGQAWHVYWTQGRYRQPPMLNPLRYDDWHVADLTSQWNHMIWAGNHGRYGNTVAAAQWMNAGVLYGADLIGSVDNFVCPTVLRNYGADWFQAPAGGIEKDLREMPLAGLRKYPTANYWPVIENRSCGAHMTYGTRRCNVYDDPALAVVANDDPADDAIMFQESGVEIVDNPSAFSFMADNFSTPEMALLAHVPGVNVLFMGGNVRYWTDDRGDVLYDNALANIPWNYGIAGNLTHDDIWMVIDGYHQGPPGRYAE